MDMNAEYRFPGATVIVIPKKVSMAYGEEYVWFQNKDSCGPWFDVTVEWAEKYLEKVS